jgi:hypothetical protein
VNSDVPGGFTEASSLPKLMAEHYSGLRPIDDPAGKWAAALIGAAGDRPIALMSAPGFMEDHQITQYLGGRINQHGHAYMTMAPRVCSVTVHQVRWHDNRAFVGEIELGLVLRFFQAEWLPSLGRRSGWQNFFTSQTAISNPASSILTESKRFPLVWDELNLELPTWRRLLPLTRDPRDVDLRAVSNCVLKSAYSNNGDSVASPNSPQWRKASREAWWRPSEWVVQHRFDIVPLDTPGGPMFPCLGVYVLDGKPAGIYGRISPKPIIDFGAIDVAVLMEDES